PTRDQRCRTPSHRAVHCRVRNDRNLGLRGRDHVGHTDMRVTVQVRPASDTIFDVAIFGAAAVGFAAICCISVGVWLWRNARMYRAKPPDERRADDGGELGDDRSPAERGADIAATFAWRRR